MTNQLMLSQVRLVYDYLCDEVARCKNGSAPIALLSHQRVLETARNGLFMVVRDTLGEGYDEAQEGNDVAGVVTRRKNEENKEAEIFGYPVADWKRVLDENSVDCPGKLAAFLEGLKKYRRVMRNHGIKNGHEELDERLSLLDLR